MAGRETHLHRASDKYQSLLWAAVVALARHGIRGTSLRDVAAEAGTSLTLISHYFGSKSELVNSAVASLLAHGRGELSTLNFTLDTMRPLGVDSLVGAWLRYAEGAFMKSTGTTWLRLMLRLQADDELDLSIREGLDASRRPVRRALRRLYPLATARSLDAAWIAASGALYTCLAGSDGADVWSRCDGRMQVLNDFLVAGLEASLSTHGVVSTEPARDAPA